MTRDNYGLTLRPLMMDASTKAQADLIKTEMDMALAIYHSAVLLPIRHFADEFERRYPRPEGLDRDVSWLKPVTALLWSPLCEHYSFGPPYCATPVSLLSAFKEILASISVFTAGVERLMERIPGCSMGSDNFPFLVLMQKWWGLQCLSARLLKEKKSRYCLPGASEGTSGNLAYPVIDSDFVWKYLPAIPHDWQSQDARVVTRVLDKLPSWTFVFPKPSELMRGSLAAHDDFVRLMSREDNLAQLAWASHCEEFWVSMDGQIIKDRGVPYG